MAEGRTPPGRCRDDVPAGAANVRTETCRPLGIVCREQVLRAELCFTPIRTLEPSPHSYRTWRWGLAEVIKV